MTTRTIAAVAFTVLGLWQLLQSITYGASMYLLTGLAQSESSENLGLYFVPVVANGISGLGLLLLRNRLAMALFPASPVETTSAPRDLQATLLAVAGLVFVALAFPQFVAQESDHFLRQRSAREETGQEYFHLDAPEELRVARVRVTAQVAVGVGLFLEGPGLAALWHRLRRAQPSK